MAKRKMVNRDSIALAARRIVDDHGLAALTMRTLASALGIKAPSLYDQVANRDEVIALVQAQGLTEFGEGFAAAGSSPREKVLFYRNWAVENKNLYPVVFQEFLQRTLLPEGLEGRVLAQVLGATGGSHIQARAIWAQLHGLVDLELHQRLPKDADMIATWDEVISNLELVSSREANQQ